jgi:hypothetical protein
MSEACEDVMPWLLVRLLILLTAFLVSASTGSAQSSPPPIHGETGTVATEGTMKTVYRGLNTIIVTTIDGIEHAFTFTKDLVVHGGKSPDPFVGLKEGTTVVVHYSTEGGKQTAREIDLVADEGLVETEGTVTKIDRGKKQITVRIGSAPPETFQLTDRAAAESSKDFETQAGAGAPKIMIYYKNENGQKVVHYFKKMP